MKSAKKIAVFLFPLMFLLFLFSCDNKPEQVELAGRFAMKGNAPFVRLFFVSSDGKAFQVDAKEAAVFKNRQIGKYRIKALAGYSELVSVDGKIKRKIYYIKDIRIISKMK